LGETLLAFEEFSSVCCASSEVCDACRVPSNRFLLDWSDVLRLADRA
jgi:hypothetical protein